MNRIVINPKTFEEIVPLFESNQADLIALGLQFVEYKSFQEDFENYFKTSFMEYSKNFNDKKEIQSALSVINSDIKYKYLYKEIISNNFSLKSLDMMDTYYLIELYPQLINHFNLDLLHSHLVVAILVKHPKLITKFDLRKLKYLDIRHLLKLQPQLKTQFTIIGETFGEPVYVAKTE